MPFKLRAMTTAKFRWSIRQTSCAWSEPSHPHKYTRYCPSRAASRGRRHSSKNQRLGRSITSNFWRISGKDRSSGGRTSCSSTCTTFRTLTKPWMNWKLKMFAQVADTISTTLSLTRLQSTSLEEIHRMINSANELFWTVCSTAVSAWTKFLRVARIKFQNLTSESSPCSKTFL